MNNKMTIGFIDTLGLRYTGDTVYKQGLGGSESAVIYLGEELAALGFIVTVYNHCEKEGEYKGVTYRDLSHIRDNDQVFDILISSRSILPLVPQQFGKEVWDEYNVDIGIFETISPQAKFKAVWMHDTFLEGEEYLEPLLVNDQIQEVFLLSDWHSHYVSQANHWNTRKRDYASLKRHIFQTRNGMRPYMKPPNIGDKDRNLFVYNSSVTKGMVALVREIWPEIKKELPEAKLTVIGGYYKGAGKDGDMDEQERLYHNLKETFDGKNGVTFTGIITQEEIAKILSRATFMVYPPAFPETFGISTLEALYYNVVPITSRFGALEQTAIEGMSYLMDYAVLERDSQQRSRFVELVKMAYNNPYLTQQKQYKCNEIREWVTWDKVALQWKAHFCRVFDRMMGREEIERARMVSSAVNRIFRTRHVNLEDQIEFFPNKEEKRLVIISPVRNAAGYIGKCIDSVAMQLYDNYVHYIVDDVSTDGTVQAAEEHLKAIPTYLRHKFKMVKNSERVGALANQVAIIDQYCKEDDIIVLLDGDDWLYNSPDIFTFINCLYPDSQMSYGSCWSLADKIPLIAQDYPDDVKNRGTYREHQFPWGIPYTHLRTFSYELFQDINKTKLLDETGNYYKAGGDGALMYELLEAAEPKRITAVKRLLVTYNDINPLNDYKVNPEEQNRNQKQIAKGHSPTNILIAIPTAKYIESETFKSIFNLEIPDGVVASMECFYGYNIAQVRNLIADFAIRNQYDYVLWVDSDVVLPRDALAKMLTHRQHYVSGVYIQRKQGVSIPEVYMHYGEGMVNMSPDAIPESGLMVVAATGFGCVLTTRKILEDVGYPQFEYTNALDHKNTVSEDVDFCVKAARSGYDITLDPSIRCKHIGEYAYDL